MKKYIVTRLIIIVFVITVILISLGSYSMLHSTYTEFHNEASAQIEQIVTILAENDDYAQQLQEALKSDFLIRAKATAYMLQYNPDIIYDIDQLEHITELLQIDEIHLFTPAGEIYSGTVPDYYGFTMDSGDQMHFFTPLLDDYDLELAQDVTPNTAEGKEMQYVAVWSEDRQHIVQIGIEPLRLLEAMKATELSYVFSRLTHSVNTTFFAVEHTSGEIISSTNQAISGHNIDDIGLSSFETSDAGFTQNATIDGKHGHVLLLQQSPNIFIGYYQDYSSIYDSTLLSICFIFTISFALALLLIVLIYVLLDQVVLRGFLELEKGIELIANGDLEYKMNVTGLPEFAALSNNVNFMVKRVVESSRKFSTIFEHINMPIAMYECKANTVITTGKLSKILQIDNDQLKLYTKNSADFLSYVEEIMSRPHPIENNVFILTTESGNHFLKIIRYQDGESDWGLIIDSTNEINEKSKIIKERDHDYLTGLYGKRAFFEQLRALTQRPNKLKKAVVVMFDLDNLKYVNDTWGHATGDKFICAAANVLSSCEHEQKICARLSGDEFAMILYGTEDYYQLELLLETIQEKFTNTYITTPADTQHKVSASIGYALYPEQHQSLQKCLNFADKAMYTAKSKCKGSLEKYEPNLT